MILPIKIHSWTYLTSHGFTDYFITKTHTSTPPKSLLIVVSHLTLSFWVKVTPTLCRLLDPRPDSLCPFSSLILRADRGKVSSCGKIEDRNL